MFLLYSSKLIYDLNFLQLLSIQSLYNNLLHYEFRDLYLIFLLTRLILVKIFLHHYLHLTHLFLLFDWYLFLFVHLLSIILFIFSFICFLACFCLSFFLFFNYFFSFFNYLIHRFLSEFFLCFISILN